MGTRFLLGAWVGCAFCAFAETRVERVFLPERLVRGNTGMAAVQEIDSASWVWHPTVNGDLERGKRVSEFVGRKQVIYFFCKKGNKPASGKACDMPDGKKVGINQRTGLPFLANSAPKSAKKR